MHICGKRYVDRVEDVTRVTVYSNQPAVELFANGKSLGTQKSDVHFFYFDVPNRGETTLTAVAGDSRDESHIRKVRVFNEDYRLKEKGAVLNWFDITEVEGHYSLNDKLGDIMKSPKGKALFFSLLKNMEQGGEASLFSVENMEPMMKMLESFTFLRMINMMGAMNVTMTKEEMLTLNQQLNQIEKENTKS